MKNRITYSLLIALCIFLTQCSSDPVEKDLLNYINVELPKVASLESEAVGAYESVAGENYTNDSAMYYKIKEVVLPKYTEFATKLKAITPATDELKKIHAEYVEASQDQLEGFTIILDALEKQSIEEVKQANVDLAAAGKLISDWKKDLTETCKKHNVVLEQK
jgi:hypothetical protein